MAGNLARRSFSTLVAAAFADGELAETERQVLHRRATELDIPQSLFQSLLEQGEQGNLRISVPANRHAREELMNDLIDVVCADGRLEAPEHHLLAKFASHIGMSLSDLRAMVRERLSRPQAAPKVEPRMEPVIRIVEELPPKREEPTKVPEPRSPVRVEPPSTGNIESVGKLELLPPGPFRFDEGPPALASDVPLVTQGLLKQAILIETPEEALKYAVRLTGLTRPEAQEMIASILRAHPDLKPGSMRIKSSKSRAPSPGN